MTLSMHGHVLDTLRAFHCSSRRVFTRSTTRAAWWSWARPWRLILYCCSWLVVLLSNP
jgi:hypothetical protein